MQGKFHYLQKHALRILTLAIYHGDLIPASHCEKCNAQTKTDGHHHDYSKPLEVVWLCRSCHKYEHGSYGTRPSPKMKKAIEWLELHPEHLDTESRELANLIGVSHTLANDARKHVKYSSNGHSQNGHGEL